MLLKEIAAQLFEHLIDHNYHGYSQVSRWGDGEGTCDLTIGGKGYKVEQGDRDCSSGIISAFEAAGISCGGATYTGNMRRCMISTGNFVWHQMSSGYVAKRGDVYLNEVNHTALCLSDVPDMLGEFAIAETGGVDGAEGDQTGKESHRRPYYNYPWDGILECVCTKTDGAQQNQIPDNPTPKSDAINVVIANNTGADSQRWKLEKIGKYYKLTNKATNKVLDLSGASTAKNTNIQVYPSNGTDAQLWDITTVNDGLAEYVTISPKLDSKMLLSVENNGLDNKKNIKIWTDLKNSKHRFYLRKETDGYYIIIHIFTFKAVTAQL